MKKTLVIGSAVADVIINLDHLPGKSEDVHVLQQNVSLGGCGFNVSEVIHLFGLPYIPFFPIGTGIYGDFIRNQFALRDVHTPIPGPEADNGCCYCFIENDGERTFVSYHGAEYLFKPDWFDLLNPEEIERVYICGLEIEETTGCHIVDYLEKHPEFQIFFAPGPRLTKLDSALADRIFALHPVLHLNEDEAFRYMTLRKTGIENEVPATGYRQEDISQAAAFLYEKTGSPVIVTWGDKGACYYDGANLHLVPAIAAKAIDTNGAGDAHIGAVLACLQQGYDLEKSIAMANRVSAKVVETRGAVLSKADFESIEF